MVSLKSSGSPNILLMTSLIDPGSGRFAPHVQVIKAGVSYEIKMSNSNLIKKREANDEMNGNFLFYPILSTKYYTERN